MELLTIQFHSAEWLKIEKGEPVTPCN